MIVGFILGILAALVVVAVLFQRLYRFGSRGPEDVIPFLRAVGEDELEALVDHREERYLMLNLGPIRFRRAQINRLHLMREKLRCRAHNTVILQEWAEYERERSRRRLDVEGSELAEELFNQCAEFRMAAFWIEMQLNLWYLKLLALPRAGAPRISRLRKIEAFDLIESYQKIRRTAADLGQAYGGDYLDRLEQAL